MDALMLPPLSEVGIMIPSLIALGISVIFVVAVFSIKYFSKLTAQSFNREDDLEQYRRRRQAINALADIHLEKDS